MTATITAQRVKIEEFTGDVYSLNDYVNKTAETIAKGIEEQNYVFCNIPDKMFGFQADAIDPVTEGPKRRQTHTSHGNATGRTTAQQNAEDILGMAGERQFGIEFGVNVDMQPRIYGDKGIDFKCLTGKKQPTKVSVDVKTTKTNYRKLLVKVKNIENVANILVLARGTHNKVKLEGWVTDDEMRAAPIMPTLNKYVNEDNYELTYIDDDGIVNKLFKPMSSLKQKFNIIHSPGDMYDIPQLVINRMTQKGYKHNRQPEKPDIFYK